MLAIWIAVAFIIDWKKALLFVVIPQQVGLFSVLIFNYVQHVHADEESKWDHSRNFVGFLNKLLFNNGYHTVHHEKAGMHWSKAPEAHAKVASKISPDLQQSGFWSFIFKSYFLGMIVPRYRTKSMRLGRNRARKSISLFRNVLDLRSASDMADEEVSAAWKRCDLNR